MILLRASLLKRHQWVSFAYKTSLCIRGTSLLRASLLKRHPYGSLLHTRRLFAHEARLFCTIDVSFAKQTSRQHWNTPQHTAAHCITLHRTAPHCITLHHTASHSKSLQVTNRHQHTATRTVALTPSAKETYTRTVSYVGWLRSVGSINSRSLLQNIVSFMELFCKRDIQFYR